MGLPGAEVSIALVAELGAQLRGGTGHSGLIASGEEAGQQRDQPKRQDERGDHDRDALESSCELHSGVGRAPMDAVRASAGTPSLPPTPAAVASSSIEWRSSSARTSTSGSASKSETSPKFNWPL